MQGNIESITNMYLVYETIECALLIYSTREQIPAYLSTGRVELRVVK